jgi:hypothetical protein
MYMYANRVASSYAMKKWPNKKGGLSGRGQFNGILNFAGHV